jgi:hypothetical protein
MPLSSAEFLPIFECPRGTKGTFGHFNRQNHGDKGRYAVRRGIRAAK